VVSRPTDTFANSAPLQLYHSAGGALSEGATTVAGGEKKQPQWNALIFIDLPYDERLCPNGAILQATVCSTGMLSENVLGKACWQPGAGCTHWAACL